jgi:putative stress-induced transcription regulator/CGNR zinc finger protein
MALGTAPAPYEMRFDAGRICLDLLSTTHPVERLDSLASLGAWITGAGLVPAGTRLTGADASWLAGFRELRSHVGRLVLRAIAEAGETAVGPPAQPGGRPVEHLQDPVRRPDPVPFSRPELDFRPGQDHRPEVRHRPYDVSLARVNDLARVAPPAPRAVQQRDGSLVRELDGPPECAALLAVIARDVVDLLTDPVARACIRQCEGDNCPIVYVDTSRGRRRRWCSSEVCGNRERVARHRRRVALARA